ncbi:Uncharacterised protein [Chlamydia abortus]|nr:Uncharacterised protein [Chlamydia abortus]
MQLCDVISLYVCLNEPGVHKDQESPRYAHGFKDSELFNLEGDVRLIAEWVNAKEIKISSNPFEESFLAFLKQKRVSKKLMQEMGISEAFSQTEWVDQEVIFRGRL